MNRKRFWVGGAAALGAGALIAGPITAFAQTDDDWVRDALDGLVADGTITQQQADAVDEALDAARPERPWGPGGGWGHHGPRGGVFFRGGLDTVADTIGIEEDALRDALQDGQTIAEVAAANGVEPQAVIDALVAETTERFDQLVADGRLDQAEADERIAEATEKITTFVNEGFGTFEERRERRADDEPETTTPDEDTESTTPPTTTD